MFKLNQATSEGWTISGDPLAIISVDPSKSDLTQRSHVFNQIMAGSAYHIEAFEIVRSQDGDRIARPPVVTAGGHVKLTAPVTVMAEVEVEGRWSEEDNEYVDTTENREVTKPTGTVARVVAAAFPPAFTLRFSDGSETSFDEESWFPFEVLQILTVYGNYGQLTVDAATGAVLGYEPSEDGAEYADIALIDVAELRETLGDKLPDAIDIALVGFTEKGGRRERADRLAWIDVRLDDPDEVDPTLAAFIKAEFRKCGRSL